MSLLNWFSRKPPAPRPDAAESSGLEHLDITEPIGNGRLKSVSTAPGSVANRKSERLERREMLYAIVRECMTQAGVLSASYKFKVLSLDSRGREYLVMMDLPHTHAGETGRLAEIEGMIARSAKNRHDILVTAVYWRVNEQVTTGLSQAARHHHHAPAPHPAPVAAEVTVEAPKAGAEPRYAPLQMEEMAAFKRALAAAPVARAIENVGVQVTSGRRNPAQMPEFADTEVDETASPLSKTQYGDL